MGFGLAVIDEAIPPIETQSPRIVFLHPKFDRYSTRFGLSSQRTQSMPANAPTLCLGKDMKLEEVKPSWLPGESHKPNRLTITFDHTELLARKAIPVAPQFGFLIPNKVGGAECGLPNVKRKVEIFR